MVDIFCVSICWFNLNDIFCKLHLLELSFNSIIKNVPVLTADLWRIYYISGFKPFKLPDLQQRNWILIIYCLKNEHI